MHSLYSLSNGDDYITSEQLQRHMLSIARSEILRPAQNIGSDHDEASYNGELTNDCGDSDDEIDWLNRVDQNNEKLTEDHLISAAVNYSHGQLPVVSRILCLNDPNLKALDHIPIMQRSVLHPLLALKIVYYRIITYLGQQPFLAHVLPKSDIQLLFLMFLYTFVSFENIWLFVPIVLYYVTFIAMVVTTFQMLHSKHEFLDFRVWSALFISYSGGTLYSDEAEFQFIRNNLKPYGNFFLALLINLMVYPLVTQRILQSELTIVAFCLTFMTLVTFLPKKRNNKTPLDTIVLFSFAVNVIAKYPYETDSVVTQGWRFLDLKIPTFASYVVGNGVEFCMNFRLLFYIFIPVLFLQLAARENWRGIYKVLIPHCVTLSWLQIIIICSEGATMFGLLRGTLALVGVVLFLPLVGLATIILPAVALTKWLTNNLTYNIVLFFSFLSSGLFICRLIAKSSYKKYVSFIQLIFSIFAVITAIYVFHDINTSNNFQIQNTAPISWDIFQKICHQQAWGDKNMAYAQKKCIDLANARVAWEGYVNEIKLQSVSNSLMNFFNKFPESVRQYFYCMYGDEIKLDCMNMPGLARSDCIAFYNVLKSEQKCTLEKHNTYTFDVSVRMISGIWSKSADIKLILNDYFKNFTFSLKPNDHIWFKGVLHYEDNLIGGVAAHVKVDEIGCLACHNLSLTQVNLNQQTKFKVEDIISYLYQGLKCVLNFLFNPVVIFK